jgi:hypothetical protein
MLVLWTNFSNVEVSLPMVKKVKNFLLQPLNPLGPKTRTGIWLVIGVSGF